MQEKIKNCQNCKKEFTIEDDDFIFYEKMSDSKSQIKIPTPTFCPDCRLQRRAAFYCQTKLYKRRCDGAGDIIFSSISKDYPGKVYETSYWWSDNWDAMDYARDYDSTQSFFKQLKELNLEVPKLSRSVLNLVNSDYCAGANNLKNCYLVFNSGDNEDCFYGVNLNNTLKSVDNYNVVKSELCYGCFMVRDSYKVLNSQHCNGCQDVYFSKNLANCSDCFGCVNLKNKKYHIFNKAYSKEEYFKKIKEFNRGSYQNSNIFKKETDKMFLEFPVKYLTGIKNTNVSGEYISSSKDTKKSFIVNGVENCKHCLSVHVNTKDCQDYTLFGHNAELVYETAVSGLGVFNLKFCYECYTDDANLEYCINCMSTSDCFACVGLRKKQYCIFNKQYDKEEYFEMVEKIKRHMNKMPYTDKIGNIYKYGEFLPPEFSTFAYNETIAYEYFPLAKEEVVSNGWRWRESEERRHLPTIMANNLPDDIEDVDDSILQETIGCITNKDDIEKNDCTTAFKVIPRELSFYKDMGIPLPRYCPNCRHHQRLENRNSLKLYKRTCMKEGCNVKFETTYAPEHPEIVYCEKCYNKEVN